MKAQGVIVAVVLSTAYMFHVHYGGRLNKKARVQSPSGEMHYDKGSKAQAPPGESKVDATGGKRASSMFQRNAQEEQTFDTSAKTNGNVSHTRYLYGCVNDDEVLCHPPDAVKVQCGRCIEFMSKTKSAWCTGAATQMDKPGQCKPKKGQP